MTSMKTSTQSAVGDNSPLCRFDRLLKYFLDKLAAIINVEVRMDRTLQDSLGRFSSLQKLGERYLHSNDELGVVRALLLHALGAGTLLEWVKQEPHLVGPNTRTEWLGFSGSLLNLSALAIAKDFDGLHDACLEAARLVIRVAKLAPMRSRAVENQPGTWGWAVLGIPPDDLRKALDQFQQNASILSTKRAKVGVIGAGWSTIIGPPSVLQLVMNECPALKSLAKNALEIKALQHTLDTLTNYMAGKIRPFWTDCSVV